MPRQVRSITVTVAQLDDGRWRLTQPHIPGWSAGVPGWSAAPSSTGEVVAALRRGFTEAQVVAHSRWRGTVYDAELPSYKRSKPQARSKRRCDVYDPAEWALDPDDPSKWISPKGHRYPEDRQAVQRVMAARVEQGLPPRPDPVNPGAMTAQRVTHLDEQSRRSA